MAAGLLDTSAVIDWDDPEVASGLPEETAVSTITLAELATGPHLSADPVERAERQVRLQQVESLFDPLDFDRVAARSYGVVVAAVVVDVTVFNAATGEILSDLTLDPCRDYQPTGRPNT